MTKLTLVLAVTMTACAGGAARPAVTTHTTVARTPESRDAELGSLRYECIDRGITEACHAAARSLPTQARDERARLYERAFALGDDTAREPWLAALRAR